MNRRERRHGRMFLLPLLLGLTGIALLVLEWVLLIQGSGSSGVLDAALRVGNLRDVFVNSGLLKSLETIVRSNCIILVYPLILMLLYAIRIPPKAARIVVGVSLAVALFHTAIILYCSKHTPTALCLRVPGYGLLGHVKALQANKNADNVLLTCADTAFWLSSVSSIFTCLIYSFVKARSDRRNAEFDQRNAYLINPAPKYAVPVSDQEAKPAPPEPEAPELPAVSDEPTRVLELPEDFSGSR